MYSNEDIQKLMDYIDSGMERIKDAQRIVCKNTIDFKVWYKYSIPEERCKYPSALGMNTSIGKLINDKMPWLKDEEYIGLVITLECLLDSMENLYDEGKLTRKEIHDIEREIVRLNFGSMVNIW